jgi:hypothetical protein
MNTTLELEAYLERTKDDPAPLPREVEEIVLAEPDTDEGDEFRWKAMLQLSGHRGASDKALEALARDDEEGFALLSTVAANLSIGPLGIAAVLELGELGDTKALAKNPSLGPEQVRGLLEELDLEEVGAAPHLPEDLRSELLARVRERDRDCPCRVLAERLDLRSEEFDELLVHDECWRSLAANESLTREQLERVLTAALTRKPVRGSLGRKPAGVAGPLAKRLGAEHAERLLSSHEGPFRQAGAMCPELSEARQRELLTDSVCVGGLLENPALAASIQLELAQDPENHQELARLPHPCVALQEVLVGTSEALRLLWTHADEETDTLDKGVITALALTPGLQEERGDVFNVLRDHRALELDEALSTELVGRVLLNRLLEECRRRGGDTDTLLSVVGTWGGTVGELLAVSTELGPSELS